MKTKMSISLAILMFSAIFVSFSNSLTQLPNLEDDSFGEKNSHTIVRMRDPLTHFTWAPEVGETQPSNVSLIGEWDWDTHYDLTHNSSTGIWTASLNLTEGMYCYKFVIGESDYRFDPVNNYRGYCGVYENSVIRVDNKSKPLLTVELNETTGLPDRVLYHAGTSGAGPYHIGTSGRTMLNGYQESNSDVFDNETWTLHLPMDNLNPLKYTWKITSKDTNNVFAEPLNLQFWGGEQQDFTWDDALIYMVMTDRFVNGDPSNDAAVGNAASGADWLGGDFAGITQMINNGYFSDLGVNALWLSPFNTAANGTGTAGDGQHEVSGYHGYWPTEAREIDPRFGDEGDLWDLVQAAHGAGIRVMGDFVVNHVHEDHSYYTDNPDWFNQGCLCGTNNCDWTERRLDCLFRDYMPDLNWKNRAASEQIIDDIIWWMYTFDLDGGRIDAVKHVDDLAITNLAIRINEEFETGGIDYYLKGETAMGWAGHNLASNQPEYDMINRYIGEDGLDGQADFVLYHAVVDNVFTSGTMDYQHLDYWTNRSTDQYVEGATMVPFIGSHDSPRFISRADPGTNDAWNQWVEQGLPGQPGTQEPYDAALQAFAWLLTIPGAPMIYQGDEYGEYGGADPDNRHILRNSSEWNSRETGLQENMSTLGQLRQTLEPLRHGNYSTLHASSDALGYVRQTENASAIVMLNRGSTAYQFSIDLDDLVGDWSSGFHPDQFSNNEMWDGEVSLPANGIAIFYAGTTEPQSNESEPDGHCLILDNLTVNESLAIGLDLVNTCSKAINYPGVNATANNSEVSGLPTGTEWYYLIFANETYHFDWQLSIAETIPNATLVTLTFDAAILNCGPSRYHDCPNSTLTHEFMITWPDVEDPPNNGTGNQTGNETNNGTGNNTGNNTGNETDEPPFDVSNISASGPYETGFHPRNRTPDSGIILEICQLDSADRTRLGLPQDNSLAENETLLCGAMVVKVVEPDGCWVEQWIDNEDEPLTNPWVKWRDICPENPSWAGSHDGISEKPLPLNGEDLVSRLDPEYEVGDAIAFPGIMCESANIWLSKRPGSNGGTVHENDTILSHWVCVDNSTILREDAPHEEPGDNQTTPLCTDGESKPAGDGCNTCTCWQGNWSCTEIGCEPVIDDANDAEGGFNFIDFVRAGLIGLIVLGLISFGLLSFRRRES